ncbi:hypothetical protein [Flavilitoribacter nigricans]|uniref:Lipoprotein n=1 Tax=Flavilitoribacter nigricans (strain ATCC 23147 / DSM 23189 / NBRC 102662 / NCIMB 1420 / SS-2) TaxID=1122177 RepID=A0A2D0N6D6_FLAN2|nr:hypothetical protein [Flavilitoribacter nigricans]PHN03343.1 hypothetical protein CRP01_27040 [Flavilitoribacter nigricans DSM 23189 = NBRC 102662]
MKKIKIAVIAGITVLSACEQVIDPSDQAKERTPENTTVFEAYAVTDANASVQAFGEVVEAFEKNDEGLVARKLQTGINALANEGKSLNGQTKVRLDRAIRKLEQLRTNVIDGKVPNIDELLTAISTAEQDVPHKLLAGYAETEVEPGS